MNSIQPDWTLGSIYYKKRIVNSMGIAHFYEFSVKNSGVLLLSSIPDDSIDIIFDLSDQKAFAAGTVIERDKTWMTETVFNSNANIVQSILNEIDDSRGIIQISDIVEKTGYSNRYIEMVFKQLIGITPKKYADIMRFQGAIDYIDKNPDSNISNVASAFGYYDQPDFIRSFKKNTGQTPSKYKKIIKDADYSSMISLQ